ncbi:hypothetical protein OFB47_27810, partial [Escherichia coli]|nr:hypothetical protein [Escherichia coli]
VVWMVPKEILVLLVLRESLAVLVKMELPARWVPEVCLVREVALDPLAVLVLVVTMVLSVQLGPPVPPALLALLASLVQLVLRVKLVPREPEALKVPRVCVVSPDPLALLVL